MCIVKKGFTLIELLVVIAIIGILSSVVLASLNSARSKGADAGIKSQMSQIRSQIEISYEDNGSSYSGGATYRSSCPTVSSATKAIFFRPPVAKIFAGIASNLGASLTAANSSCAATDNSYGVFIKLKSSGAYFCIDSSGAANQYTTFTAFSGNTGPYTCP